MRRIKFFEEGMCRSTLGTEHDWPGQSPARRETSLNPIVRWIGEKPVSARDYLGHLIKVDLSLSESLRDAYAPRAAQRRLALSLFVDYAYEQNVGPGELALLMGDAIAVATQALNYLIGAALQESAARPSSLEDVA